MQETQNRISQHDLSSHPTRIRVVGYTYLVDFSPTTQPRFHTVNKQRRCSCELGAVCPALTLISLCAKAISFMVMVASLGAGEPQAASRHTGMMRREKIYSRSFFNGNSPPARQGNCLMTVALNGAAKSSSSGA